MELPSEVLLWTSSHCQRLLLTAILLASVATAQLTLYPEHPNLLQGEPFTWTVYGAPTGDVNYTWYRGNRPIETNVLVSYVSSPPSWITGPANTGRENVTARGSLNITELEISDTGNYVVMVSGPEGSQEATGQLRVWEKLLQPDITVNTTSVAEFVDIVSFMCHPNNTGDFQIKWYLNYRPLSKGDQWALSPDNRILTGWVTRLQYGPYFCQVSNPAISMDSSFKFLDMYYGPDDIYMRASPLFYNGIIKAPLRSKVDMKCSTMSQPACRYRWLHNGTALESTSSIYSIESMSWGDLGTYRCIAENPKTQIVLYSAATLRVYENFSFPSQRPYTINQGTVIFFSIGVSMGLLSLIGALIFYLVSRR